MDRINLSNWIFGLQTNTWLEIRNSVGAWTFISRDVRSSEFRKTWLWLPLLYGILLLSESLWTFSTLELGLFSNSRAGRRMEEEFLTPISRTFIHVLLRRTLYPYTDLSSWKALIFQSAPMQRNNRIKIIYASCTQIARPFFCLLFHHTGIPYKPVKKQYRWFTVYFIRTIRYLFVRLSQNLIWSFFIYLLYVYGK